MALSPKQQRFVQEYLVDLNATQSAIRAGYSKKTARAIGQENLTKPDIQAAIEEAQQRRAKRVELTQDMVLSELAAIALASGADFASVGPNGAVVIKPTDQVPESKLPAIASIKQNQCGVEVKLHDKVRALELLGKHLGVFDLATSRTGQASNLLDALTQSTKEVVDTGAIPEIEPPAEPGDDLVE